MEPGKYKPESIVDYGVTTTNAGDPQVFIVFKVEGQQMTWFGSLKEGKARDITIKAVLACGFHGKKLSDLAAFPEMKTLKENPDVSLTIDEEEYDGKIRLKIKWINKPFEVEKLDRAGAVAKMQGMNLDGDLMRLKSDGDTQPKQDDQNSETTYSSDDDIPF